MWEPVGLHCRLSTSTGNVVSPAASPPSMAIVQICREPPRPDTNATVRLSGAHVGDVSLCALPLVSCRRPVPSLAISHRFVAALFVSGSHALTVKTIHLPSGDGTGS